MKIAIYINNENISDVDCTDLTKGNPGVGGTEYCMLLLAQLYKKYYPQDTVVLIVAKKALLPCVDEIILAEDLYAAVNQTGDTDILLVSAVYKGEPLSQSFFDFITKKKVKTILWGHNFYLSDFCKLVSRCSYVKANVFVGRQQYDRYVDHKVIKKSTYIYNMYPQAIDTKRVSVTNNNVTYIGSLVSAKGFHVLANAWKNVLQKAPDATLNVVGSGKLYGRNFKLGKYDIAEEEYENEFMPGLVNEKGEILPSVHFLGVLGAEKNEVIKRTSVGVVNPTGRTETFGISALDFESLGVPVVTIAKGGFLDTVIDHKTGLLYNNIDDLAENIVQLIKDPMINEEYGKNGISLAKEFLPKKIIKQWNNLFCKVINGQEMDFIQPDSFMSDNLKSYRCLNRQIKNKIHMEYPVSMIGMETMIRKMLRMLGK